MATATYEEVLQNAQHLDPLEKFSLLREVAEDLRQDEELLTTLGSYEPGLAESVTRQLDSFALIAALLLGAAIALSKQRGGLTPDALAEAHWDATFASSQDALARLADEALADFDAGRTEILWARSQRHTPLPFHGYDAGTATVREEPR